MNADRLGWVARTLRVRLRVTQVHLAARAGVSRRAVSQLETGHARRLTLEKVESILSAVGARVDLRVLWHGPDLDRLLDANHAALVARVKQRLEGWGWVVAVEVSYNHYGERGRIDLLAFHPVSRLLLVAEVKTELVDVQSLLGLLDVKARLGLGIGSRFGWNVAGCVPAIVFLESPTTRARIRRLETLFDRYATRGRAAVTWLRRPSGKPSGLLWFMQLDTSKRAPAGGQRVYHRST